ncbi:MAG: hypothetical protein BGO51_06545 [Rhodospirillales bacterium 69-11]|nr:hypothetical protein [Rhodospirillales bacterium]MBN8927435.1 hypothetical protein [Rhodospirillales bacterium]OJW26698.1 MAG: hypothetical protein BGO51_06545 [Rhodospirillales bacterium 69-11]
MDIETGLWRITDMPPITPELQQAARISMERLHAVLVPATREWSTGAIAALLTHFYTVQLPAAVYTAIKNDWIACLSGFPQWAIEEARIEWLKNGKRKPVPADIVGLCRKAVSKERAALFLCQRIIAAAAVEPDPPMTPEEREASRARVSEMVRMALAGCAPAESGAM